MMFGEVLFYLVEEDFANSSFDTLIERGIEPDDFGWRYAYFRTRASGHNHCSSAQNHKYL